MGSHEGSRNDSELYAYLSQSLGQPCPPAAVILAQEIEKKHPGSAIVLYGSGISIMQNADAQDVLYDFYVIAPSYAQAFKSKILGLLNYLLPPNVFYIEHMNALNEEENAQEGEPEEERLRAKYAVLSISHLEKLVSKKTFHSYFWGRFAQPTRLVHGNKEMQERIITCVHSAVDVFVERAKPLLFLDNTINKQNDVSVHAIWRAGLGRSYRAELRAEAPDRVDKLLAQYGDWPMRVTKPLQNDEIYKKRARGANMAWRVRAFQGGLLSALRLLKGTFTFEGGIDYVAWKASRHAGFGVSARDWERRWPFFGSFTLALRYYRLKKQYKNKNAVNNSDTNHKN